MAFKALCTCLDARRHKDDDIMIFPSEWDLFILAIILATLDVELEALGFWTSCIVTEKLFTQKEIVTCSLSSQSAEIKENRRYVTGREIPAAYLRGGETFN